MISVDLRIGTEWRKTEASFESINPFTQETWAIVPEASAKDVDDAVRAARDAFDNGPWPRMESSERAAYLHKLADLIERDVDILADYESSDNGKGIREITGQIESIPSWYRYYADLIQTHEGRVANTHKSNFFGFVVHEPVGVVAAILPWNSPLFLLAFKLAPALAAGCTFVAKPSEVASVSILHFAKLVEEAGIPAGVFNTLSGIDPKVGASLVGSKMVDKVSFTGSEQVGALVASAAGSNLAGVTLELGGKSANIVFEDADLDQAINGLIAGIFAAGGQTCIAGSRALIHKPIFDEVINRLVDRVKQINLGDPKDHSTDMGPLASQAQFDKVSKFIEASKAENLDIRTGGKPSEKGGLFYEPTIIVNVPDDAAVWCNEIFGPVLALRSFETEEEAFQIANDSNYGLAAGVWSKDINRAFRATKKLKAGTVWVNSYRTMGYTMPFGGIKNSGYGRENGVEGLLEYLVTKSVWIETEGISRDPFKVG